MNRDAVVLLWLGDEARLAGPEGRLGLPLAVPAEAPARALLSRLAEEFPGARAVRILYQPVALNLEMISPDDAARRRPASRRQGGVWSLETGPSGLQDQVLASETHSPLRALAQGLEAQGVCVEGAWTLASLLDAMPRNTEEGLAFLQLVISGSWALLSSADALGRRRLRLHRLDAATELAAELRSILTTFDEHRRTPAWVTIEDGIWPPEIRDAIRSLIPTEIPLASLIAQAPRLTAGAPSDFLRPPGRFARLRRPIALGGAAALCLAVILASWRRHESQAISRRQRLSQETADLAVRDAHLASARKLEEINRALEGAAPPRYRLDLLLLALSRETPPGIRLLEIASQGSNFLLRGRIEESGESAGDLLEKFRRDLSAASAPWEWTEAPPPAGREFLWRGRFPSKAPDPARTPEEGTARLTQVLGQLPSSQQAEHAIASVTRGWTEVARRAPTEAGRLSYAISPPSRRLAAWSDIVATVQALIAMPGITLDALELEAGDDMADAFTQARLEVGARFRPE